MSNTLQNTNRDETEGSPAADVAGASEVDVEGESSPEDGSEGEDEGPEGGEPHGVVAAGELESGSSSDDVGESSPEDASEEGLEGEESGDWRALAQRAVVERMRLRMARVQRLVRTSLGRLLPGESQYLFALTLVVGVLCGLVAVAFHLTIQGVEHLLIDEVLRMDGWSRVGWTLATPAAGGLLAGLALKWLVPGAAGSGVPQVKRAFAMESGRIRVRDAIGKFVLTATQIGTGASLGREGPTVYICAATANLVARVASLPPRNARRLTPVGVAAGIAAAFNAPIAAVTFTIEEIVGALDHSVLSGVVVAAATAAVIERSLLGVHPMIQISGTHGLEHVSSLLSYGLLGVVASVASVAFTDGLLRLRGWFRSSCPLPKWSHPAVGGLMTGLVAIGPVVALDAEGVAGGGYPTLSAALAGNLTLQVLLALAVAKTIATIFSYSSGGVGGVFAPTLFIGAMVGGAVGYLDVAVFDHGSQELGAFALVGMGAMFAGVIRAPITSVLIIFEMTGNYELVLPLMLANSISYIVARRYRPTPIYEALLAQDGVELPARGRRPHPLEQLRVRDAMTAEVVCAPPEMTASEAAKLLDQGGFALIPLDEGTPPVRRAVHARRVRAAVASGALETALGALAQDVGRVRADVPLLNAVVQMNELGVRQLVVTDAEAGERMVGILAMTDLVRAHARLAPGAVTTDDYLREEPSTLPELRADHLCVSTPLVDQDTSLHVLLDLVAASDSHGVLLRADDGHWEVVMQEDLHPFVRDEDLQRMLRAADVAHPVPRVEATTDFDELVRVLVRAEVDTLVVVDEEGVPMGVVTRSLLADALLHRYATEIEAGGVRPWSRWLRSSRRV